MPFPARSRSHFDPHVVAGSSTSDGFVAAGTGTRRRLQLLADRSCSSLQALADSLGEVERSASADHLPHYPPVAPTDRESKIERRLC